MKAIIQAGGRGTRLHPFTLVLPKPLMPVGGQPVIEMLLKWLRRNGIAEIWVTIGYLGHLIRALCGDGSQWDMKIEYSEETEPLSTMGPLKLIEDNLTDTFLVLNGDLISDLDLRSFIDFHRQQGGLLTVATTYKDVKIDLGVFEKNGTRAIGFKEKPRLQYPVSMGIYCMEPPVIDLIPKGVPFGFDDLMYLMLDKSISVFTFEHNGIWMDIGRKEDFLKAQEVFANNSKAILGV
jgi:mannose-1-phosphate guanylyltransferase